MNKNYPRDMIGYGDSPPHANWPNGARIAVQFVLNYEEGSENNVLHGDPSSEAFLSEIVGIQARTGQRHISMGPSTNTVAVWEFGEFSGFLSGNRYRLPYLL